MKKYILAFEIEHFQFQIFRNFQKFSQSENLGKFQKIAENLSILAQPKKYPEICVSLDVYISLVLADFSLNPKACWRYNINVLCYGNSYAITADWCDSSRRSAIVTDWSWGRHQMADLVVVRHSGAPQCKYTVIRDRELSQTYFRDTKQNKTRISQLTKRLGKSVHSTHSC